MTLFSDRLSPTFVRLNPTFGRSLLAGAIATISVPALHAETPVLDALVASTTLDTVVVTANRQPVPLREVAASLTVLTADNIAQHGQTSIADVLRSTPGVNVSGNGGIGKTTALRIRGEESFRTLVLIDGMNISDTSAPQVSPRFEDLLSGGIERVEILRGPQGMMYGADAGGIVNITTRRAHEPFAMDAAAEYGSYDSSNLFANIRGKGDSADYSLSATHFDTDGFNGRTIDATRDKDGYLNTTLHFNGGVQINDDIRIETVVRNVRSENEYDGCFNSISFSSSNHCYSDYDLTAYRIAGIFDNQSMLQKIALQRSHSTREDFVDGSAGGPSSGTIDEAQYQGIFRFAKVGDLVYGADLKQEKLDPYGSGNTVERDQLGYYAEWQGKVADNFYYTAGARHDNNDDFGDHNSYHLSAAYVIDMNGGDTLKLKTTYGTGFRAPSLYELAYNAGPFAYGPASTTRLKEESSKGLDAGVEYHWRNGGSIEVVYFDQSITDEIQFDLVNFYGYLQDEGITHSRGVEISGVYPITTDFRLLGNYTYNDTQDPNDDQRVRRPRHLANIGFDFAPVETVTVFANLRIVRDNEDQIFGVGRTKLDDYSALEASVSWAATSELDIYVRGENLLRDDYQEVLTYNVPKQAVYAGVRVHFK